MAEPMISEKPTSYRESLTLPELMAIYGFDRDHEWFKGLSNSEILAFLREHRINALFGAASDPELASFLRRGGVKIFAEFAVFVGEEYWEKYPESRPVTADGEFLPKIDWYAGLNPADQEVRREKLSALERLLEHKALDGVWLDFIRWPGRWEEPSPRFPETGFDKNTLERFQEETGIAALETEDPKNAAKMIHSRYRKEWVEWKCHLITSWVEEARALVEEKSPGTLLGLFGIPWTSEEGYGIESLAGQDYEGLALYVDIFSPMVYHRMCGRETGWITRVSDWVGDISGKNILPIVQAVNEPGPLPADEFGRAVEAALLSRNSKGVIFFNLNGMDLEKLAAAEGAMFSR